MKELMQSMGLKLPEEETFADNIDTVQWTRLRDMLHSTNNEDITLAVECMKGMMTDNNKNALNRLCLRARKYHLKLRYVKDIHESIATHLLRVSTEFK